MKSETKDLLYLYMIPLLCAVVFAFCKNIQLNGEDLTILSKGLLGFFLGMGIEGMLIIVYVTVAILKGE